MYIGVFFVMTRKYQYFWLEKVSYLEVKRQF